MKLQKLLENAETGTTAYNVALSDLIERLEPDMLRAIKAQLYPTSA